MGSVLDLPIAKKWTALRLIHANRCRAESPSLYNECQGRDHKPNIVVPIGSPASAGGEESIARQDLHSQVTVHKDGHIVKYGCSPEPDT